MSENNFQTTQSSTPRRAQQFLPEYKKRMVHPANILATCVAGVVTAIIGPFGTYEIDPLWFRLIFWFTTIAASTILANFFGVWANIRFAHLPFQIRSLIGGGLFSALYSILIWCTVTLIYPESNVPPFQTIFLVVIAVSAGIYGAMWIYIVQLEKGIAEQIRDTQAQTPAAPIKEQHPTPQFVKSQQDRCPFLKRLGSNSGKVLIRLAMSDHYIEAHTETGMHLVYMRFADAVAELDPNNGTQVHRSHWVNFSQIQKVVKTGQKSSFLMSDGTLVPISRSHRKRLQDRGLL